MEFEDTINNHSTNIKTFSFNCYKIYSTVFGDKITDQSFPYQQRYLECYHLYYNNITEDNNTSK